MESILIALATWTVLIPLFFVLCPVFERIVSALERLPRINLGSERGSIRVTLNPRFHSRIRYLGPIGSHRRYVSRNGIRWTVIASDRSPSTGTVESYLLRHCSKYSNMVQTERISATEFNRLTAS